MTQEEPNIRPRYTRSSISNALFYIPFGYYYVVRLGTMPKLLSWVLIYIMPTAFYSAFGFHGSPCLFAINYLLILIATFSVYEYGYIYNDTVSIRHEQQPALRLYESNLKHFEHWKPCISGIRLLYTVTALSLLLALNENIIRLCLVVLSIAVMCLLFAIYNRWRNKYNVWLYPLLVFSRYIPFMLLYDHDGLTYLLLFLSFPLLNALERFSMPRYRWPLMSELIPNESSKTRFRIWYYAIISMTTIPTFVITKQSLILLLPIVVLLLYRLILALWLRSHHPDNYLNG